MNKMLNFVLFCICFLAFSPIHAITINVPSDYTSIQDGINASINGDTILVAPGSYAESLNFGGRLIVVKSELGPLVTTITQDFPTDIIIFNNGENSQAVIEGFLINGGRIGVWCQNSGPTIKNNIFYDQNRYLDWGDVRDWAAISLGGATYASLGNSPAIILNNTVINCGNGGISSYSTSAPTIKNNIVAYNVGYGIHRFSSAAHPMMSHNDVYRNDYDSWDNTTSDYVFITNIGVGAISVDPLLNTNHALASNSPCIDKGDPSSIYNDPDGSRNDIGAVPFVAPIPPPPRDSTVLFVPSVYPLIQTAINVSLDGDTIFVGPGTYNEAISFNGKNILIKSTNGPLTTILTKPEADVLVSFENEETADAILDGFHLNGSRIGVDCRTAKPTLKNIIFTNQIDNAIYLHGKLFIRGQSEATIINCSILFCEGTGITNLSYTSPTLINTIIAFCEAGIRSTNIFSLNPPPIMSYCNVYDNKIGFTNQDFVGFTPTGDGLISVDPLLNANFTLQELSPCIDAGDPNPLFNDPDNSRNDIGALPHYVLVGDLNNDGGIDISDLIFMVNFMFLDGISPNPLNLSDFNTDGAVDIADLVSLIAYMFGS